MGSRATCRRSRNRTTQITSSRTKVRGKYFFCCLNIFILFSCFQKSIKMAILFFFLRKFFLAILYYQSFPRKIQLDLLKRQFKLRKKLQKWRDIQLDHFGFERSQGLGNNSYTVCFQMLDAFLR